MGDTSRLSASCLSSQTTGPRLCVLPLLLASGLTADDPVGMLLLTRRLALALPLAACLVLATITLPSATARACSADAPAVRRCARYAQGPTLATERAALGRPTRTSRARP